MDVTMSSFEIKLFKALATTNTPPLPLKGNVEVWQDHFWSRLNNFDQGGASGGTIPVPKLQDMHSVDKKVQNSSLSKIVEIVAFHLGFAVVWTHRLGLSLSFQVTGWHAIIISRWGTELLESCFSSIFLLFHMKVGWGYAHSRQGKSLHGIHP